MEGKKKYFALVIFLFLGLMVFTFANPAEEDTEFTDGGTNTSETTKKNDKTTTTEDTEEGMDTETILNNVTNTNTNTNNTTTVTDTSLADAIAAVEKAEGTYTQEDVDAAKELVNNVTDTTEKGELENRLAEVEAGIAVDALLAELENKVEEAANKDDMNTATDYRDENEIADKIAALTNETVQEALYARLDEVSKLLDDNAAPVITGVEDGKAYAENTTITIEDAAGNAYIVTMLKDGEEVNIEDGYTTTGEGVYTLTVVDEAFNEATVTFTVDMTDPTFAEITNGGHYDEVTVNVEDLTDVTITVTNMDTNETTTVENGTILTEEATYKLVATDAAGNKTTYYVAIDKTAAKLVSANMYSNGNKYIEDKNTVYYTTNGNVVTAYIRVNEQLKDVPVFTFELGETVYVTTDVTESFHNADDEANGIYRYQTTMLVDEFDPEIDGDVIITVSDIMDRAGNTTDDVTSVTNKNIVRIDRTAPVYSIYKDGQRPVENVEVTEYNGKLYFNTDAEIQFHDNYRLATISLNDGSAYTTTVGVTGQIKYVREDGEYKYVVTDRAGNQTTLTVVRDTVSPEVTEHSYVGENPYSGMSFKLYDNSAVDKFILNDKEFDRTNNQWSDANYENIKSALINGENTLVLYDIAGNTTTHTFTLDRVAPTITVKESSVGINNLYSQLDLKLYDANGVASVVINGTQLSHTGTWVDINDGHAYTFQNGENVVVVTDTAGNVTTQTFNTTKFNLVVENGIANLTEDVTLIDSSFYNKIDEENEVTINGNGKTVTQYITSVDKMQWTHNNTYSQGYYVPVLANVFSSLNGAKVTVNNVKFKGTVNTIMLGNYETTTSNWFNTELNNVDVVGLEVVSFSANISPAVVVYGNATLNNTNIYGTTRSSLENAADDPYWPIYDLAVVNFSKTSINGGKIGTIYTWAKARLEINNAEVDTITSAIRKTTDFQDGELLIGSGTKVNKIIVTNAKAVITIKAGATVDTIDFNGLDQSEMTIVIEDGATVNNQIA